MVENDILNKIFGISGCTGMRIGQKQMGHRHKTLFVVVEIRNDHALTKHRGDNAPLATVLDSGVFSSHPLPKNVIVAEEEFDTTENTTANLNGHGTDVADIVVYGGFSSSIENRIFILYWILQLLYFVFLIKFFSRS